MGLAWTAPSAREDGDSISLSEIQSYTVRYGREEVELNQQIVVDSANKSYQIDGFESGIWYFGVQVVDIKNRVGELSTLVKYNIP